MSFLDATTNSILKIKVDFDADNWICFECIPEQFFEVDWLFIVAEDECSDAIYSIDKENTEEYQNILLDPISQKVFLKIEKEKIPVGNYYYRFSTDTSDALFKLRFGGNNQLEVIKF